MRISKRSLIFLPLLVMSPLKAVEFRSLFNGKDLAGWTGKGYEVVDNAIVCTPEGRNLLTDERFTNYILDFEFQVPPGGNNGLGIHYPGSGDAAYTGMELQILDDSSDKYKDLKDYQFHGSIYTMLPAKKGHLKPVGEWNRMEITMKGDRLTVILNDKKVIDNAQLPGVPVKGPVGLQHHGSSLDFANVWIKEL